MTSLPRPGATGELHGNTVRIVHGPIRLAIITDDPLPTWAWPQIADLAALCAGLAEQLTTGRPEWVQVEWVGNAARADEFATVDAEANPGFSEARTAGAREGDVGRYGGGPDIDELRARNDIGSIPIVVSDVDEPTAADEPPSETAPSVDPPPPPATGRRYQRIDCPDCGKNVSRAQYGNHRRLKHPELPHPEDQALTRVDGAEPVPAPKPPDARAWANGEPSSEVPKPEAPQFTNHESRITKGTSGDQPIDISRSTATAAHTDTCECLRCWTRNKATERQARLDAEQHARDTAIPWGTGDGKNPPRPTVRLNHPPAHELT